MNLLHFQKPSRYINNEVNAVHKKAPVRVALAFPDIYEVGMSHLGLKILYSIINNIPFACAERVFSPWLDLEEGMKKNGMPLSSLESGRPLEYFDIVGFSLQYELSYTTVLNMLYLGGIPLRSDERLEKKCCPLVIAGGPCTVNPHPMSAFVDAFAIGDAEDSIKEILHRYHQWKNDDPDNRLSLLRGLSEIEGVFVPYFGKDKAANRRILSSLEDAHFPDSPVVPFTSIIHDRVNIEISRGCSMGCRFCQAGMTYRPVRERSPEKILKLAESSLKNTGYDSISFTSLSSGDYSCLTSLMKEFNRMFNKKRISMSLPSLRVASVNSDMLEQIKAVRRTGFTIAPEAGTERLRAVINKDFSEETYVRALETLFRAGWHNLKLYFMTGLPTETWDDVAAIPEMVLQAIKISKKLTGRHVNLSVGISSFIPKPHTPFQWFGQNDLALLKEKNNYLKRVFLKRGVKFKGHDEEMSLLEAVFARGDESLSNLIEKAWSLGCRLDAWTEAFDFEKWEKAMDASGVNPVHFALRDYREDSPLPWDNINVGITKEYLWREYQNAVSGRFTADCRDHCHNCGLKCKTEKRGKENESGSHGKITMSSQKRDSWQSSDSAQDAPVRARLQYSKTGAARYLSHLELTTAIIRSMRRANFPFKYSGGFHPAPRISFGPALRVGIAGLREYLDVEIVPPFEAETALNNLNRTLPEGIRADSLEVLFDREKSLNSFIIKYVYEIKHNSEAAVDRFLEMKEVIVNRDNKSIEIKKMVEELIKTDNKTVCLTIKDQGEIKARLDEILPAIFDVPVMDLDITRISMAGQDPKQIRLPERENRWAVRS
ncbi:MAG: TIGR03960 family B12-binding radical SAM protein [Nitrospirota bacterium]